MVDGIGAGLGMVITIVAYTLVLSPLLDQRRLIQATSGQIKTRRAESSKLNTSLLALKKLTIEARTQLEKNNVPLESAESLNRQIAELTGLLTACELTIEDVQTGRIMIGRRCDLVPIRVSGQGNYDRFVYFLHKLSLDLPDISVTGLDLQGLPERPGAKGSFVFDLFWFAAPSLS
jgi:Tfp pilus assembly protein PilO